MLGTLIVMTVVQVWLFLTIENRLGSSRGRNDGAN